MINLNELNQEQRQCVESIHGPALLLAGAGTGKTRVITYRIAHMIASGIQPKHIVALTFTNKAAREMRERVDSLCPGAGKKISVGTFHSYCLFQLRKHYKAAGLEKNFSIANQSDQYDLVRKSLEEKGWAGAYRADHMHAAISYAKNQLCTPNDVADHKGLSPFSDIDPEAIAMVYGIYQRQLDLHKCIDFDDCIYRFMRMMSGCESTSAKIIAGQSHLLVDEFQDTNHSQLEFLHALCKEHRNICVVGDDDQSIYSWRGAMSAVLLKFEELYPERTLVKLEQNYRCSNVILAAANKVIKNNPERKPKTLWSASKIENKIILAAKPDESEESRWIAERCLGFLGRGYQGKDIAILYRANAQARSLEVALRQCNLPYKVIGGQSLFERKEVKDVLAFLHLIAYPGAPLPFWRVVNLPPRGLGLKSLEEIGKVADQNKCSPMVAITQHLDQLPARSHGALQDFSSKLGTLKKIDIDEPNGLVELIKQIIKTFRLETHLRNSSTSEDVAAKKIESIRRMPEWLDVIGHRLKKEFGKLTIRDLMDTIILRDTETKKDEEDSQSQITLMTIHGAKGLEFQNVFVCGLEEGLFPHRNSLETTDAVFEERRLFYVAITRAKENLLLSYCHERSAIKSESSKPSRFLEEIPDELLVKADEHQEKLSDDQKRERTRNRLSRLRSSLGDLEGPI